MSDTIQTLTVWTDGSYRVEDLPRADDDALRALQVRVGGWIEAVTLTDTITMFLDEEGRLKPTPYNEAATRIAIEFGHPPYDPIYGSVVFTGPGDEEGRTLGLNDEDLEYLVRRL